MSKQLISAADIEQRKAEARKQHGHAVAELHAAESEASEGSVSGAVDDLTLARADKKLGAARDRVRRWAEQIARLDVMREELEREATAKRVQSRLDEIQKRCQEREKTASELDDCVIRLAELFVRLSDQNQAVFSLLPYSPPDMPALFTQIGLQNLLMGRVCGLTDGRFRVRGEAGGVDYLRKGPTLAQRAAEEGMRLVSEYARKLQPTPPEAA